jgi:hypothetical protein
VKPHSPTLYIDHSIVSTEPLWPRLEQALGTGNVRLVPFICNFALMLLGLDAFRSLAPILYHVVLLHAIAGLRQRFHNEECLSDAPFG